jgi:hypothetical protein
MKIIPGTRQLDMIHFYNVDFNANIRYILKKMHSQCTVKPVHVVTSVKQPLVFKGHLFCPVIDNFM